MAVRKLRRSWWVDFRWRGRRIRKRSPLNSADGARQYEVVLRRSLHESGTVDRVASTRPDVALAEFSNRWLCEYVDVNNGVWEQYKKRQVLRRDILPLLGARYLREITTHDIETLKRVMLARNVRPKTVNNTLAVLGKCLATAVEWGALEHAPKLRFLRAAAPAYRFLEHGDLESVLTACDAELRLLVLAAARTGLRWSELVALEWGDLDSTGRVLTVQRAIVRGVVKAPKNGRIRHVPLSSDLAASLACQPRSAKLVFHRDGRPLCYDTMTWRLRRACRTAGVPVVTWHPLRHTFATHLSSAGAPIKAVQELLGHSSLAMTMRYTHASDAGLRAAVALLETGQHTVNIATEAASENQKTAP